jgi:GAF domain-containing protein
MKIIDPVFAHSLAYSLATSPQAVIAFLNGVLTSLPGVRTVTWLAVAPDRSVTHRIGTSDSQNFPIGGFDPIDDSAWNRRILVEQRAVVGDTPEQMTAFIPETDQLVAMGYGATLCAPIIIGGEVRGVLCALGDAGILTPDLLADIDTLLPIAALVFTFEGVSAR